MSANRNPSVPTNKAKRKKLKRTVSKRVKEMDDTISTVYWSGDCPELVPYLGSDSSENEETGETDFPSNAGSVSEGEPTVEGGVKYYSGNDMKVLIFKKNSPVYVSGACRIQVLYGGVETFGYEFRPGDTIHDLYSLRGWSQMYLRYGFPAVNCKVAEALKRYEFDEDVIRTVSRNLTSDTAVVCCFPLDDVYLKYIEKCISVVILPPLCEGFQAYFSEHPTDQILKIGGNWCNLVEYKERDLKVMLCGGKGVGKSTLLRYMINKLLTFHEKVTIIDLDPGQPEFTMPGCISIVTVDKPIFGPNFTHQRDSVRSILQNVDVSYAPLNYVEAVQNLYQSYVTLENAPTLINTMGFTMGLGLEIMCSVIAATDPRVLIEMKSHKPNRNFSQPLTKDTIYNNYSNFLPGQKVMLNYQIITLPVCFKENMPGFNPPGYLRRHISTISYFGNILNRSLSLRIGPIPMYRINLNTVTVLDNECHSVKERNKAAVINANIVALCSTSEKPDIYVCYGYGIVRNVIENELYLITPVKDLIHRVTHLIVGTVEMVPSMLDDGVPYDGPIPYFSTGCLSYSMSAPRRSYLPRKSF